MMIGLHRGIHLLNDLGQISSLLIFFINIKMVRQRVGDGNDAHTYSNYFTKYEMTGYSNVP